MCQKHVTEIQWYLHQHLLVMLQWILVLYSGPSNDFIYAPIYFYHVFLQDTCLDWYLVWVALGTEQENTLACDLIVPSNGYWNFHLPDFSELVQAFSLLPWFDSGENYVGLPPADLMSHVPGVQKPVAFLSESSSSPDMSAFSAEVLMSPSTSTLWWFVKLMCTMVVV